eukprot:scaffold3643_cov267-Pinguiococcus_pyrenoidosus.AAC.7
MAVTISESDTFIWQPNVSSEKRRGSVCSGPWEPEADGSASCGSVSARLDGKKSRRPGPPMGMAPLRAKPRHTLLEIILLENQAMTIRRAAAF